MSSTATTMDDKELFREIVSRLADLNIHLEVHTKDKYEFLYYNDLLVFNTSGFNLAYNIEKLGVLLKSIRNHNE